MRLYAFARPKFVTSAVDAVGYPILRDPEGNPMVEIAVAGRSNVGKSSLLNVLFQTKGMVKTSSTPGKTQMLNFFTLDDRLAFVDLPGYGYAKVPLQVRAKWGPMVHSYLSTRPALKLILCLFDIRRDPNQDDMQLIEWAAGSNKAVILVLTKIDKINQSQRHKRTKEILNAFGMDNLQSIQFSSTKGVGRKELIDMVHEALEEELAMEVVGK